MCALLPFSVPLLYAARLSITQLISNEQTAAAIFSQLNDYRMTKNMAPLGWLNPWLYGIGYLGMNDITSGNNPGCGTDGFEAAKGWDPVRPASHSSLHFAYSEPLRSPA